MLGLRNFNSYPFCLQLSSPFKNRLRHACKKVMLLPRSFPEIKLNGAQQKRFSFVSQKRCGHNLTRQFQSHRVQHGTEYRSNPGVSLVTIITTMRNQENQTHPDNAN
jgi:hypothetical protein